MRFSAIIRTGRLTNQIKSVVTSSVWSREMTTFPAAVLSFPFNRALVILQIVRKAY